MSARTTVPVPKLWGTTPTYAAVHQWLRSHRGRAAEHPCALCDRPAAQWSWDHTGPALTGIHCGARVRYSADVTRYQSLCFECHVARDRSWR